MTLLHIFYIFSLICIQPIISQETNDFYTAAVVSFAPSYNATKSLEENIRINSDSYITYIAQAKGSGSDIIVFPEYGLTGQEPFEAIGSLQEILAMTTIIPLEKYQNPNPCENKDVEDKVSSVVLNLSCAARDNKIYVVVNLPERTDNNNIKCVDFYNTNIVFDRQGAIIARYRKRNLYQEPYFKQPNGEEEITFNTDFGVKFGIFTCFDIIFDRPAGRLVAKNITDFIYPTAWVSELPFLTALQVQSGWARMHKVNLIAANYVDPKNFAGGSGIYSTQNLTTDLPIIKRSTMSIARVTKIRKNAYELYKPTFDYPGDGRAVGVFAPGLHTLVSNLTKFSYQNLNHTNINGKVVHGNFSCSYHVQMSNIESKDYNYKIVAYQGPITVDKKDLPVQVCGVVACLNASISSCGVINYDVEGIPSFPTLNNVTLEASIATFENSVVFPSIIDYRLNTMAYGDYSFSHDNTTKITLNKEKARLMTFGIIAHTNPNSGNYLQASRFAVILIIAMLVKQLF